MFLRRNGFTFSHGSAWRWLAWLPVRGQRAITWLYWDVWWGSWLSYRMTNNPRTVYLVAAIACSLGIYSGRRL